MGKEKVRYGPKFEKDVKKFRDRGFLERIKKQINKIRDNSNVGKPLKYDWKGSREVRIGPYRLFFKVENNIIYLLRLKHKDELTKN